jgi:hypothetical protein
MHRHAYGASDSVLILIAAVNGLHCILWAEAGQVLLSKHVYGVEFYFLYLIARIP